MMTKRQRKHLQDAAWRAPMSSLSVPIPKPILLGGTGWAIALTVNR